MLGAKTSNENAASALVGTELFRGVQAAVNVKVTAQQLKDFAHQGNLPFPAAQVPSTDPNTLDDYEEGTWTPGFSFNNGTTGLTYTTQVGSYTKMGDRAFVQGYVRVNDNATSTGPARITGLPFTSNAASGGNAGVGISGFGLASISGTLEAYIGANNTNIELYHLGTGTGTQLTDANVPNSAEFIFGAHYRV
jgi:hypothetical protein